MERLPVPVRQVLREPFDQSDAEVLLRRGVAPRPKRARRAMAGVAALAAAALLGWAIRAAWPASPPQTAAAGLALPERTDGAATLALDDGSRIEIGAGAHLETLQNDAREVVLLAQGGTLRFDVRPGGPRRWTIECGLATVVVVGTRFTIESSPQRLRVAVERGAVLVRGERVPDRARRVSAGQEIVIEVQEQAPTPPPAAPEEEAPQAPALRPSRDNWRAMAERGAWDAAYDALGERGIEREAPRASVEELFELADVARLSGHPAEAIGPLERIVREHRSDPSAGLAAFTLGRVEADAMHRPDRAVRAFEQAIELGLNPALQADARARLERARAR